jgi:hypothetical protein
VNAIEHERGPSSPLRRIRPTVRYGLSAHGGRGLPISTAHDPRQLVPLTEKSLPTAGCQRSAGRMRSTSSSMRSSAHSTRLSKLSHRLDQSAREQLNRPRAPPEYRKRTREAAGTDSAVSVGEGGRSDLADHFGCVVIATDDQWMIPPRSTANKDTCEPARPPSGPRRRRGLDADAKHPRSMRLTTGSE